MMKKTIFFVLCMTPIVANADIIRVPSGDSSFGSGPNFSANGLSATDNTYVFESGSSLTLNAGGMQIDRDFYVGRDSSDPIDGGYVYIASGTTNPFTLRSDGNISVGGTLWVDSGLYIGEQTGGGDPIASATFGGINATGVLEIEDVDALSAGSITSETDLKITANTIDVTGGGITLSGTSVFNATGAITAGSLNATGDNVSTTVNAGSVNVSGTIQNLGGTMAINTGTGAIVAGNIENSSAGGMTITAGDITVSGTMKNDQSGALLKLTASSLTVNGADTDPDTNTGASLVLSGNFEGTISGTTHLENGIAWGGNNFDRTFNLTTGSLTFGSGAGDDAWTNLLTNNLNDFKLTLTDGGIDTPTIVNGNENSDAQMVVSAQTINADSITNSGALMNISTNATNGGNIVIGTNDTQSRAANVLTANGSGTTNITSNSVLDIKGSVSQNGTGTMTLNGSTINMVSAVNNGGTLNIIAPTDTTGAINISGNITNESGTTTINGQDVIISGVVASKGGTTTIQGSHSNTTGSLTIGAIDVDGGTLNLNALIGNIQITNSIDVADGGAMNIDTATHTLDVGGTVNIAGDFTLSDTDAAQNGSVNIAAPGAFTLKSGDGTIDIGGDLLANTSGRQATFDATKIDIGGVVNASADGTRLTFGTETTPNISTDGSLNITGAMTAANGAIIEIYSGATTLASLDIDGKLVAHGNYITATSGGIDIAGGVLFNGTNPTQTTTGLVITGTNLFTLKTDSADNGVINIGGGINTIAGNTLALDSASSVDIGGAVSSLGNILIDAQKSVIFNGDVNTSGQFVVGNTTAVQTISMQNIENSGVAKLNASGNVNVLNITNSTGGDIDINGAQVSASAITNAATATINATDLITIGGLITNSAGELNINAKTIEAQGVVNSAIMNVIATNGTITLGTVNNSTGGALSVGNATTTLINTGAITNSGTSAIFTASGDITVGGAITNSGTTLSLVSGNGAISAGTVSITGGTTDFTGTRVEVDELSIATGAVANVHSGEITVNGDINASGMMVQGASVSGSQIGTLNLENINTALNANNLTVNGFTANENTSGTYTITNNVSLGTVSVANGASVNIDAGNIIDLLDITNSGTSVISGQAITGGALNNSNYMDIIADNSIVLTSVVNTGALKLDSGTGIITVNSAFEMGGNGTLTLSGSGLTTWTDDGHTQNAMFSTDKTLYQNYAGALQNGDINVVSEDYTITASGINVAGINQTSGKMVINASDVNVDGRIVATDLRFAANPADNWMTVDVAGAVSGGVDFIGLKSMNITGDYIFSDTSIIDAAILERDTEKYWATVSLVDDKTLGQITNTSGEDASALITVDGSFISDISSINRNDLPSTDSPLNIPQTEMELQNGQVGITLFDTVDQGSAIWLLHADGGIREGEDVNGNILNKLRNLNVKFCNADATICINYLDTLNKYPDSQYNVTDTNLPAYLSVRDTDGDGNPDSLYIVFDPRFGGPVEVFKIQPIVDKVEPHTTGEYVSAGALDDLIEGQLLNTKFYNSNPIELIPEIFKNTNMSELARELYDRMEYYNMSRDGTGLARFSRLFQVRELEQVAGSIALNEHTNFRSFEDRMFDEFIWNRNRSLKKAWADFDFGMFSQNVSDGKRVYGNRFSVSGGFDWQHSETLILGLTARVSNMSSDNFDELELGYMPGDHILGRVDVNVADTNIGLGGYMMKTLGEKTRVYGNAFLDIHLFDISRTQNYVGPIDGTGTAFSLISEWGLLHDWLNQYVVGNLYARIGYNTGFSITEQVAGADYMNLESDGYFMVTPGYSLIAQKRIYTSSWFQMRPYLTVGIEYDVLGAPDYVKYKFAPAHRYTQYDIDLDPLWANAGGGIEFLSASGIQIGIDYRYQYNNVIQLHNIKVSGSYRF